MPKSLQIKIKNYDWIIVEATTFEDVPKGTQVVYGHCDYIEQTIRINAQLRPEQKRQTLMHELTHAFMQVYGFGQVSEMGDEVVCDFIGCYADDIVKIANEWEKR